MKILLALVPLVLASCGPLSSEKQEKNLPVKHLEEEIDMLKAGKASDIDDKESGVDGKGADKHSQDDDSYSKDDKYKNKKGNIPNQSPWQGKSPVQSKSDRTLEVSDISYAGSGCSDGSLGLNISDDGRAFTLLFSEMSAYFDPTDTSLENRVNCNIDLDFVIPQGWRFTIMTLDYRGFAELYEGDKATLSTKIGFDQSNTITKNSVLSGEFVDDFEVRQEVAIGTNNWVGCDDSHSKLNLDVAVNIANQSNEVNEVTVDSLDGELTQKFVLVWDECQ